MRHTYPKFNQKTKLAYSSQLIICKSPKRGIWIKLFLYLYHDSSLYFIYILLWKIIKSNNDNNKWQLKLSRRLCDAEITAWLRQWAHREEQVGLIPMLGWWKHYSQGFQCHISSLCMISCKGPPAVSFFLSTKTHT